MEAQASRLGRADLRSTRALTSPDRTASGPFLLLATRLRYAVLARQEGARGELVDRHAARPERLRIAQRDLPRRHAGPDLPRRDRRVSHRAGSETAPTPRLEPGIITELAPRNARWSRIEVPVYDRGATRSARPSSSPRRAAPSRSGCGCPPPCTRSRRASAPPPAKIEQKRRDVDVAADLDALAALDAREVVDARALADR